MRVEWSKMAIFASFVRYIFPPRYTFTSKATFIILCYVVPWWLFNDTEIDDLEWPFCVINMFRVLQLMGWRLWLSVKTVRNFAELPNTHTLSATKM